MKRINWIIISLVAVVIIGLAALALGLQLLYLSSLKPVSHDAGTQLVEIKAGTSSGGIAKQLEEKGLIKNALAFQWYVYKKGISTQIQAGLYRFSPQQGVPQIASMLTKGDTATKTVTITGGMRLREVVTQLQERGYEQAAIDQALAESYPYSILKDKPANVSLEGYLFPDTYRPAENVSAVALIDLILSNTERKVTPAIRQGWANHGLNLHQGLTLSSIIQKEASRPEDQVRIAQVFYKRLAIGKKLETDPTFEYAAYLLDTSPSIRLDSPYNTYVYGGLPPGPIANSELDAMQAAAAPAATDYLYFLADREGNTHFSTTEEEHKQNIEKYLR